MGKEVNPEDEPVNDDPAYIALWDQYKSLKARNSHTEQELLEKYGPNAKLDWRSAMEARMEAILDACLPPDTIDRLKMEIEWQKLFQKSLDNLRNHIIDTLRRQEREARAAKKGGGAAPQPDAPVLWTPPGANADLIVPG